MGISVNQKSYNILLKRHLSTSKLSNQSHHLSKDWQGGKDSTEMKNSGIMMLRKNKIEGNSLHKIGRDDKNSIYSMEKSREK